MDPGIKIEIFLVVVSSTDRSFRLYRMAAPTVDPFFSIKIVLPEFYKKVNREKTTKKKDRQVGSGKKQKNSIP